MHIPRNQFSFAGLLSAVAVGCFTTGAAAQLDRSARESVETAPIGEPDRIYTVETAPEIDGTLEEKVETTKV